MVTDNDACAASKTGPTEGVLGGWNIRSSGGRVLSNSGTARTGKRVVTRVFLDGAERYLSQGIFD